MLSTGGGDLDVAAACAKFANKLLPADPVVSDTLGWIYLKQGLSEKAIPLYKELVAKSLEVSTYCSFDALATASAWMRKRYAVFEDLPGTATTYAVSNNEPSCRSSLTVLVSEEEKCWMNQLMSTPAGCCGWPFDNRDLCRRCARGTRGCDSSSSPRPRIFAAHA